MFKQTSTCWIKELIPPGVIKTPPVIDWIDPFYLSRLKSGQIKNYVFISVFSVSLESNANGCDKPVFYFLIDFN